MKKLNVVSLVLLVIFASGLKAQSPALSSLEAFAKKLAQTKVPQLLDARSAEEFAQNHIKGALNVDAKATDYQQKLDALDKYKATFVYSIANGRSTVLSRELRAKGFKDVEELPGGLANWIGSGYPIVSTTKKGYHYQQHSLVNWPLHRHWFWSILGHDIVGPVKSCCPCWIRLKQMKASGLK